MILAGPLKGKAQHLREGEKKKDFSRSKPAIFIPAFAGTRHCVGGPTPPPRLANDYHLGNANAMFGRRKKKTDSSRCEGAMATSGQQKRQQLTTADGLWRLYRLAGWSVSQHESVYLMPNTHTHTHGFPAEGVSHAQVGCHLRGVVRDGGTTSGDFFFSIKHTHDDIIPLLRVPCDCSRFDALPAGTRTLGVM